MTVGAAGTKEVFTETTKTACYRCKVKIVATAHSGGRINIYTE
jgi:hypothetical protein